MMQILFLGSGSAFTIGEGNFHSNVREGAFTTHSFLRGRAEDLHVSERPITTMPHRDVLIIDEASKTLIPEFMVPALMARR